MPDTRTIISYIYPGSASNAQKTKRVFKGFPATFKKNFRFEKYKGSNSMGYGIERCLYEFNSELSCLSPHLIHAAVLTPQETLTALEGVAQEKERPLFPIDRHLAAFLVSRWKGICLMDLRELDKPQREVRNLAALRILAHLQSSFSTTDAPLLCPHLGQWMADLCAPLISGYHNRKVRAKTEEKVAKAAASGDLTQLLTIFDKRPSLALDAEDFQMAKIEMLLVDSEIKEIEAKIQNYNTSACLPSSLWEKVKALFAYIPQKRDLRKSTTRKNQLHEKQKNLQRTWDEIINYNDEGSYSEFWDDLWRKMNSQDLTLPSSESSDPTPKR
ncbi:MAG: hypothetical protein FJX71_00940 [Alphaproteobacteria bacterium]|nr:hypothetical protein [Alphaproteobacteria bacterium]